MPIIFPGIQESSFSIGAVETKHLLWIAESLRTWGRRGRRLSRDGKASVERVLRLAGKEPGPLEWRIFAEHSAGADARILIMLRRAHGILDRLMSIGVEDDAIPRLQTLAEELDKELQDAPVNSILRLRWLFKDMVLRLESENDPNRLGDIHPRIDEAAALAVLLGFESPPMQRLCYSRTKEKGLRPLHPRFGRVWPDPFHWNDFRYRRPDLQRVHGYRLHDPTGRWPIDLHFSGAGNNPEHAGPRTIDPWRNISKISVRDEIIRMTKLWQSALDGIEITAPPTRRPLQAQGEWSPPKGYVSTKGIELDERFRKEGVNPRASTIQRWRERAERNGLPVPMLTAPDGSRLNYYDDAWIAEQIRRWNPRGTSQDA